MSTTILTHFRQAREGAGLTQSAVAESLGIAPSAVSRIESGARRLTAPEARAAAGLFGVDVGWLLAAPPTAPLERADLRGELKDGDRAAVAGAVERGLALSAALALLDPGRGAGGGRARGAGPEPGTPFLAHLVGHRAALDERARLRLGRAGAAPLGAILDSMGITVVAACLPGGLSGVAVPGEDLILVAAGDTPGRQRFTLARQYGALYLADSSPMRRTAAVAPLWAACLDTFAATLLLPTDALEAAFRSRPPSATLADAARVQQLARQWGVSATFVVRGARNAGLMSADSAAGLEGLLQAHGQSIARLTGLGPQGACDDVDASRLRLRALLLDHLTRVPEPDAELMDRVQLADPTLDLAALRALAGEAAACF